MRIRLDLPLSLQEIALFTNAEGSIPNTTITHVSTDTRTLSNSDLFIALRGERFNGEDFVTAALARGAYALAESADATLRVSSVNDAIPHLIQCYMNKLTSLRYTVAITGSVGKTTTKELLYALISAKYRTHATKENQNNLYGVLYTALSAPRDVEVLIFEVGMNHEGEIKRIADAINPHVGVITNIGSAHIGNLGTRENIAREKLEICTEKTNICIVPSDEALLAAAPHRFSHSTHNPDADVYLIPLRSDSTGTCFDLYSRGECWLNKRFPIAGRHHFDCFCAAVSAARYMSLRESELDSRLPLLREIALRQKFVSIGKYKIYDDSYSASYEATVATMEMLALYREPLHAVLFDMLELGEEGDGLHRLVGSRAAELGIKSLFAVGEYSGAYAEGARSGGMKSENIHINKNINDLSVTLEAIRAYVKDGILLVKGSRKTHAERIIDAIRKENTE